MNFPYEVPQIVTHQILEEEIQKVEETFGKVVQLLSLQTICLCHPECNEGSENIHSIRFHIFLFRLHDLRNFIREVHYNYHYIKKYEANEEEFRVCCQCV